MTLKCGMFREAVLLAAISAAVAGAYNASSPKPLPWIAKERVLAEADISSALEAAQAAPAEAAGPQKVNLTQARELFLSGRAVFVDARAEGEFQGGHIAGAVNVPYEKWEEYMHLFDRLEGKPVVVYCGGAECKASLHLSDRLAEMGFAPLFVFFGGWQEWQGAGYDTE
jgi:rhodanese-related sulfurtransferase